MDTLKMIKRRLSTTPELAKPSAPEGEPSSKEVQRDTSEEKEVIKPSPKSQTPSSKDLKYVAILADIGQPTSTTKKDDLDKDFHKMIKDSVELGDATENVRRAYELWRQVDRTPDNMYSTWKAVLDDEKSPYQKKTIALCFLMQFYTDTISAECCSYKFGGDCNLETVDQVMGAGSGDLIKLAKAKGTFDLDMGFGRLLFSLANKEIDEFTFTQSFVIMNMDYYLNKFGMRLAVSYISLFYRIAVMHDHLDKFLCEESLLLTGVEAYTDYTKRGLYGRILASRFQQLKLVDSEIERIVKLETKHMRTIKPMRRSISIKDKVGATNSKKS